MGILTQLNTLPEKLLSCQPDEIHKVLSGPTLIHLEGQRKAPILISTLLHGNEPTGFWALQQVLRPYFVTDAVLPRSVSILIGNPKAAQKNVRSLPGELDLNRVWDKGDSEWHDMAQGVVHEMKARKIFASVDIHNNTGQNPYYACLNKVTGKNYKLCRIFSDLILFFDQPLGVLSKAFSKVCPSIILEAGVPQDPAGIQKVRHYLETILRIDELEENGIESTDLAYHVIAMVRLKEGVKLGFGDGPNSKVDLCLDDELESHNFQVIPSGTCIGWHKGSNDKLEVTDNEGKLINGKYFDFSHGQVRLKHALIPIMITHDIPVIQQDCLCYLVSPFDVSSRLSPK
ncbi:MAG: peptidase M14 [Actinobacteria bacterium]|nr:peptidase M14 [Actinomycetota bacterium]